MAPDELVKQPNARLSALRLQGSVRQMRGQVHLRAIRVLLRGRRVGHGRE